MPSFDATTKELERAQKRGGRIVALDEIMKLMCATLLPRLNRIKMRMVNKLKKEVK